MKYLLVGGAGVFAVHTAKYLLEKKETTLVISVGRNKPKNSWLPRSKLDPGLSFIIEFGFKIQFFLKKYLEMN